MQYDLQVCTKTSFLHFKFEYLQSYYNCHTHSAQTTCVHNTNSVRVVCTIFFWYGHFVSFLLPLLPVFNIIFADFSCSDLCCGRKDFYENCRYVFFFSSDYHHMRNKNGRFWVPFRFLQMSCQLFHCHGQTGCSLLSCLRY